MLFRIRAESDYRGKSKPCKNAFRKDRQWFVDIATLESLMELLKEVKHSLVISEDTIVIYDYLME